MDDYVRIDSPLRAPLNEVFGGLQIEDSCRNLLLLTIDGEHSWNDLEVELSDDDAERLVFAISDWLERKRRAAQRISAGTAAE